MTIRWISPEVGTAPARSVASTPDNVLLDVRDLVDKSGNTPELIRQKIEQGIAILDGGSRLVVCCDHGISRSNAIAAGILARRSGKTVDSVVREIVAQAGAVEIKIELLSLVRNVVDKPTKSVRQADIEPHVLVTGASGLIGQEVTKLFKASGIRVCTPTSADLDLIRERGELDMLIRSESINAVVHLANPRIRTTNQAMGETLVMLRNILETCVLNNVWLLYPSSWEVYQAHARKTVFADEETPVQAIGPNGETKLLCETLIQSFRESQGLQCALIRSSTIYGPGTKRPPFISGFVARAIHGEPIGTHRYANADPALDLLHVNDLARAIIRIAEKRFTGDLNLGTGVLTPTRSLAKWIVEWLNSESAIENIAISGRVSNISMNCEKAANVLNWRAEIGVKNGLRTVIEQWCSDISGEG